MWLWRWIDWRFVHFKYLLKTLSYRKLMRIIHFPKWENVSHRHVGSWLKMANTRIANRRTLKFLLAMPLKSENACTAKMSVPCHTFIFSDTTCYDTSFLILLKVCALRWLFRCCLFWIQFGVKILDSFICSAMKTTSHWLRVVFQRFN